MSNKIYQSIIGVMSEIGAIEKGKTNSQQGFKYRGIDDVMNALQPLLIKNGVFVVPEVLEQNREDKVSKSGTALIYSICKIRFTFYADDGSNITAVTIGEGMDSGDKATNKAMAIAFKYACFQVFCIPTEEMKDPDSETYELKPQGKTAHDYVTESAERDKQKRIDFSTDPNSSVTEKQVNRFVAMKIESGYTNEQVGEYLAKKFNKTKVETLTKSEYDEICKKFEDAIKAKKNQQAGGESA